MGLWELTSTVAMSGTSMPGGMAPQTQKVHVCITPENWNKATQGSSSAGCQRSNESTTATGYSADIACPSLHATGHMSFTTPESGRGSRHLEVDVNGRHMITDTTSDMHFLSARCGSVAPDHPEIIR